MSRAGGCRAAVLGASLALAAASCSPGEGRARDGSAPGAAGSRAPAGTVRAADPALAAMARELLPGVESGSGLRSRGTVRLARRTREELSGYLEGQLEESLPAERAARISDAYRRLGLLPDTLELRGFLRELYLEQVAGYYDPAADTLFVMEGSSGDELRTVLVHEMVHALQDQRVDLDSISDALERENDRSTAFQAAVEGHATYVMTEWRLGRITGRDVDLTAMPDLMDQIRASAGSGAGVMPVFASAPRIIRETLTFPYLEGMGFVQQIWRARSARPPPFDSLLPHSTEQVIHPAKLAGPEGDVPTVVEAGALPDGWSERYADRLGELELRIYLAEHLPDDERPRRLAAGWDGDLVVLARREDGREVLGWLSVWDDAAEADSAAAGLGEAGGSRYPEGSDRAVRVHRRSLGGRPGVVLLDLPAGEDEEAWLDFADRASVEELRR